MTEATEKYLVNKAWMTEKSQSSTVTDSTTAEPKHKGNINLHQQNVTSFKKRVNKIQGHEPLLRSKIQQLTSPCVWHWYYCTVLVISSSHLDLSLTHPICQATDQTNASNITAFLWTRSSHSLNLKDSNAGTSLVWKSSPTRLEVCSRSLEKKINNK